MPCAPRHEQIIIATAGGAQGDHGYWLQPFCTRVATAIEINLPKNWDDLILGAEIQHGAASAN